MSTGKLSHLDKCEEKKPSFGITTRAGKIGTCGLKIFGVWIPFSLPCFGSFVQDVKTSGLTEEFLENRMKNKTVMIKEKFQTHFIRHESFFKSVFSSGGFP